jgi:hypothetical protein
MYPLRVEMREMRHPNRARFRSRRKASPKACSQEYIEYIDRLKGGGDSDCYWHNEAWIDAWSKWIEYQSSVDRYIKSKEFKMLLDELKQTKSE